MLASEHWRRALSGLAQAAQTHRHLWHRKRTGLLAFIQDVGLHDATKNREDGEKVGLDPVHNRLIRMGWSKEDLVRGDEFKRWLLIPCAMINHLCLGSIFAWSLLNQPLMRISGVVTSSAGDWALSDVTPVFSLVMGGFAIGAVVSEYLDRWGPRCCCLIGATSLFSGFSLASLAASTSSLPLLYMGGLIWGLGNAFAYVPPVSTLIQWYPERKGFGSSMAVVGFGAGAMVAAPLFSSLLKTFERAPIYLGKTGQVHLVNREGRLFADDMEVVVATAKDICESGVLNCDPGVYVVGTGSTGVVETFAVLGLMYGLTMGATAFTFRIPRRGYRPPGVANQEEIHHLTEHDVSVPTAMKTWQFWALYGAFGASITGAYGLLSCAKILLMEQFGSAQPEVITTDFATSFVAAISLANLAGRIGWTNGSDYIAKRKGGDPFFGRQLTYNLMFGVTIPAYAGIIASIHAPQTSILPLALFSTCVFTIISSFGGSAATRPALVGDLYGLKNVGVLSARQLSVVLPAAFLGPYLVTHLRQSSANEAMHEIARLTNDADFLNAFGASRDQLETLIQTKTVTIHRLLEIAPEGTIDPTPFLYENSIILFGGLQFLAVALNSAVQPIPKHYHDD